MMTDYYLVSALASVMAVLLLGGVVHLASKHGLTVLFYPAVFIVVFFSLIFLVPMAIAVPFQDILIYRYQGGYRASSWMFALIFAFLFVVIACIISILITPLKAFRRSARGLQLRLDKWSERANNKIDIPYMVIFYVLPLISLLFLLVKFGGSNYQDYMVNRTVERSGMGYIIMPSTWLTISLSAGLFSAIVNPKWRWKLIVIIPFVLFFIAAQLYLGSKSRGLIVLVYAGLTWGLLSTLKSKFPLKVVVRLATLAVFVSVIGLYFGDIREAATRQASLDEVETRVALSAVFSRFNPFGAIENTIWLVENTSFNERIDGRSFAAVIVGAVPRSVWPEKPVGGGPALRNLIHPGSYDLIGGFQLSSYSPGIIAEAYMNFGYFGLIVIAPIFGFALAILARFLKRVSIPFLLVIYVILLYRMTFMLTGEVFGSVSGIFMTLLPVGLYLGLKKLFAGDNLKNGTDWKMGGTIAAVESTRS